jgi:hypothetical protein
LRGDLELREKRCKRARQHESRGRTQEDWQAPRPQSKARWLLRGGATLSQEAIVSHQLTVKVMERMACQSNGVPRFWFDPVLARSTNQVRIPQTSTTKHNRTEKVIVKHPKRSTNPQRISLVADKLSADQSGLSSDWPILSATYLIVIRQIIRCLDPCLSWKQMISSIFKVNYSQYVVI